jgi:hypothetical protein
VLYALLRFPKYLTVFDISFATIDEIPSTESSILFINDKAFG